MLAELVLTHPALLFGIGAVAIPILIHLLLRPRPRRTRFPAIVLLHTALVSGRRASRLRNLLLLAVRAALLGLVALLLAGPTCAPRSSSFVGTEPVACVVILDDSASMSYRAAAGMTLLETVRERARDFVASSVTWPEGSVLTVLSAGSTEPPFAWTADRVAVAEALHELEREPPHARPLGAALRTAAEQLRSAKAPAHRIVIFTDAVAHAWRDVTPAALSGIDNLALRVVVPEIGARSNIALLGAAGPERLHPVGSPVLLRTRISAEGLDGQCWLLVRQGDRTLQRVGPLHIPSGTTSDVEIELPNMGPGPQTVTLQLEPPDRMNFDQQRFVAFQVGPRPLVWLVSPGGAGAQGDVSALILRNLLAPEALSPERQLVELLAVSADPSVGALSNDDRERTPALAVVLPNEQSSSHATQSLVQHVERGATALLVPGSADAGTDWPGLRSLLSAATPRSEQMAAPGVLRWEPDSPCAGVEELAELAHCAVRRRVVFDELRDDVIVEARYSDDVPAVVSRRVGRGRLVALTTSPDPQWSDLGIRAAGLISWLHQLVDESVGQPGAVAAFSLGQHARHAFTDLPAGGLASVSSEGAADGRPTWIRLTDGVPREPWPTSRAGVYSVAAAGENQQTAAYVVNWPAEESQLQPIELPRLKRLLGCEEVSIESLGDADAAPPTLAQRIFTTPDLGTSLAALLLVAFAVEMLLATRRSRDRQ